jgi:hypothetical protein
MHEIPVDALNKSSHPYVSAYRHCVLGITISDNGEMMENLQETRFRKYSIFFCPIGFHWICVSEITMYLGWSQTNRIRLAELSIVSGFKVQNLNIIQEHSGFPSGSRYRNVCFSKACT